MEESGKTRRKRGPDFHRRYFAGKVIDIGCGRDVVVPHAEPFDKEHGDANRIDEYRPAGAYDCVHSAHCLEHMHDPPDALARWWQLVRPGGYLVLVVPHEDLFEQGIWPSLFNRDHKATFRLDKPDTWSPVSYDILGLARALPGAVVISAEVHDDHYDHSLRVDGFSRDRLGEYRRSVRIRRLMRDTGLWRTPLWGLYQRRLVRRGIPVAQTFGMAMAQIQIVLQKQAG